MSSLLDWLLPKGTTYAAVSGFVTDSYTGFPIAGATASIGYYIYQATTDSAGYYLITGLLPGTYTVTVSASGYQTQSKQFTAVAGEVAHVDFKLVPLVKPKIMLIFQVYDAALNLIPNAKVTCAGQTKLTQSDGETDPFYLDPGTYNYTVSAEGFLDENGTVTLDYDKLGMYNWVVSPTPSHNSGLKGLIYYLGVQMTKAPTPPPPPTPTQASVTFTVFDKTTNSPIASAAVSIWSDSTQVATGATDPNGKVSFLLNPGSYRYTAGAVGNYNVAEGQLGYLVAGQTYTFTVYLEKKTGPATLKFEVKSEYTGSPVANATIVVTQDSTTVLTAKTDSSGHAGPFTVNPGTYTYTVTADGYKGSQLTAYYPPGYSDLISVWLEPAGGPIANAMVRFSVYYYATNAPIPNAKVTCGGQTKYTDDNGMTGIFTLLAPKSYDYTVEASGYETVSGNTGELKAGQGYLINVPMKKTGEQIWLIDQLLNYLKSLSVPWYVWAAGAGVVVVGGVILIKAVTSKPSVTVVMPSSSK